MNDAAIFFLNELHKTRPDKRWEILVFYATIAKELVPGAQERIHTIAGHQSFAGGREAAIEAFENIQQPAHKRFFVCGIDARSLTTNEYRVFTRDTPDASAIVRIHIYD